MVVSPRQPGSALKPFLYALAFDRGYTPATVLPDIAARVPDLDRTVRAPETTTAASTAPCARGRRSAAPTTFPRSSSPSGWVSPACSACCAGPDSLPSVGVRSTTGSASRSATAMSACWSSPTATVRWRTAACGGPIAGAHSLRERSSSRAFGSPPSARRPWCSISSRIRWPAPRLRTRDTTRLPLSRRRQDRYQPTLHRQLGGRDDGTVHCRGLGRQLQRTADGRCEWREWCRSACCTGRCSPPLGDTTPVRCRPLPLPVRFRRLSVGSPALPLRPGAPAPSNGFRPASRRHCSATGIAKAAWSCRWNTRTGRGAARFGRLRSRGLHPLWRVRLNRPGSSSSRRSMGTCTASRRAQSDALRR